MTSIFFEELNSNVSESNFAMHSLLVTNGSVSISDSRECNNSGTLAFEESDVYQCGKCKKMYTSFSQFINHKKLHGSSNIIEGTKRSLDDPLILSDTDILSFSIDQNDLNSHVLTTVPANSLFTAADSGLANLQLSHQENSLAESIFSTEMDNGKEASLFNSSPDSNQLFASSENGNYLTNSPLLSSIPNESTVDDTLTISIVEVIQPNSCNINNGETITINPAVKPNENTSKTGEKVEQKKKDCPYCNKIFVKNFDLEMHIRSHTGERPFQCVVCGQAFKQKSHIGKHMVSHKVWPERASTLMPSNSNENAAETSESLAVNPSQYHCQFCSAVFSNYLNLRNHRAKNHLDRKVYKCIQVKCDWTSPSLESFLEHLSIHNNEATYACRICSKVFTSLDEFGVHQYYHEISPAPTVPKTYTCKKCKRKFSTKEGLNIHLKRDPHKYPCPICRKQFVCERFLRKHVEVHNEKSQSFKCTDCDKVFKRAQYLAAHKKTHSSEKPFDCPECSKKFLRSDLLNRHLLIHNAKRFKCSFCHFLGCKREFYRKDKLKEHIATHCKQKTQKVKNVGELCQKDFESTPLLLEHKSTSVFQEPVRDDENRSVNVQNKPTPARKRTNKKTSSKPNKFNFDDINRELDDNVPTIEIVVMPLSKNFKTGKSNKKCKTKKINPVSKSDISHIFDSIPNESVPTTIS